MKRFLTLCLLALAMPLSAGSPGVEPPPGRDIALRVDDRHLASILAREGAARTAARYAPSLPGTHANLGILEYLNGNPDAALDELRAARAADPKFDEQFRAALEARPELEALREDKEFLARLFPPASRP